MSLVGDLAFWIMTPLHYLVSGILVVWHWLFAQGMPSDSGWTWFLAIICMTATIRALLTPLNVKQIRANRAMHSFRPQLEELQKTHGHDRKRLQEEQMKLWKDAGTHPFASCLPLIVQLLIWFALLRVIDLASRRGAEGALGFLSGNDAESLSHAKLLGAEIAGTLINSAHTETTILTLILVIVICVTQFMALRQLLGDDVSVNAVGGPYAQQQRFLLYALPLVFFIGGMAFPLSVLAYWATWNLWTVGEQTLVLRDNPAPGGPAGELDA